MCVGHVGCLCQCGCHLCMCVCVCVWRSLHRYVALWKSCVVGTLWMHNEALNEALACQKTHLTPTENLPAHPDSTHPCPGSSYSCLWPSPVQWPRTLPPSTALAPHTLMMSHPTPRSLSSDFPHTSTPIPGSNRAQPLVPPPVSSSIQPLVPPQVFDSSLPSLLPSPHHSTLTPRPPPEGTGGSAGSLPPGPDSPSPLASLPAVAAAPAPAEDKGST